MESRYKTSTAVFSSKSIDWRTPQEIFDELNKEFDFDYDPCPYKSLIRTGLLTDWGKRVYCNPPYNNIYNFIEKALIEIKKKTELVVFLLPSRTDSKWFHDLVLPYYHEIRLVRGRVRFNGKTNAPFASCIIIFKSKKVEG